MTLWRDGRARGTAGLERPVMVTPSCDRRIGVTSEVPSQRFRRRRSYGRIRRTASSRRGRNAIEALRAVTPGTRDFIGAAMTLARADGARRAVAINQFTAWEHPSRKDRRKIPLEIEALYRAPMDASRVDRLPRRGREAVSARTGRRGLRVDHVGVRLDRGRAEREDVDGDRRARHVLRSQGGRVLHAARADAPARPDLLDLPDLRVRGRSSTGSFARRRRRSSSRPATPPGPAVRL